MSRPSNDDAAGARAQEAGERVDQRRLAGAVRADDAEQLAGAHVERDAPERRRRAVGDLQVAHLKHGRLPEVGRHHVGPLHDLGGAAFGEQLAVVEARRRGR